MEEHFKNKLKNHKVDWDKEELLGNLQQELARDQSNFDRKWFLLLPLLFLATCWGVSELEFSNEKSIAIETEIGKEVLDSKTGHERAKTVDSDRSELKTKGDFLDKSEKSQKVEMTNSNSFPPIEKEREQVVSTSSQIQKSEPIEPVFQNIDDLNFQNKIIQNRNTQANKRAVKELLAIQNEAAKSEERNMNEIAFLPSLTMMLSIENEVDFSLPEIQTPTDKIIPIKEADDFKNSFFATASADAGMVFRNTNLMTDNPEGNNPFKSKERALIASNFKIGYQHKSGFSLASGLEYTEIREFLNFDIDLGTDTFKILDEKASFFLDQNLDTIFIADSTTVIETKTRQIRHNNKHTFLTIPLQLSFRKTKGRTDIFGTVGVSYAFSHKYNGREVLWAESERYIVKDDLEFNLKNRIGVQLGIGAEYPIYRRARGFASLNYRRTPTLLFFDDAEQFYHSVSLDAGVRYSFF